MDSYCADRTGAPPFEQAFTLFPNKGLYVISRISFQ